MQAQCIGVICRPYLCAANQLLYAAMIQSKKIYLKNHPILLINIEFGFKRYRTWSRFGQPATIYRCIFCKRKTLSSQIVFSIVLVDKNNKASIFHHGSSMCKRLIRSVMAAKIHGLLYGFEKTLYIQTIWKELTGSLFDILILVYSKTSFSVVARDTRCWRIGGKSTYGHYDNASRKESWIIYRGFQVQWIFQTHWLRNIFNITRNY